MVITEISRSANEAITRRTDGWPIFVDTLTSERRSDNMRRIKATDTSPELKVRRLVHAMGFRYRLHVPTLPGKPDLVFPRLKKIIEVRGCFWHQHGQCVDSHVPLSRRSYWGPKLARNKQRDRENQRRLRKLGWDLLVLWECVLNNDTDVKDRIQSFLRH
jgi:DNA mismatch endonuclease (patch repair protein)